MLPATCIQSLNGSSRSLSGLVQGPSIKALGQASVALRLRRAASACQSAGASAASRFRRGGGRRLAESARPAALDLVPKQPTVVARVRTACSSALSSALRLALGCSWPVKNEPGRRYSAVSPRRSLGPHRDIRPWRTESENYADGNGLEAPAPSRIPQLKGRSAEAC